MHTVSKFVTLFKRFLLLITFNKQRPAIIIFFKITQKNILDNVYQDQNYRFFAKYSEIKQCIFI